MILASLLCYCSSRSVTPEEFSTYFSIIFNFPYHLLKSEGCTVWTFVWTTCIWKPLILKNVLYQALLKKNNGPVIQNTTTIENYHIKNYFQVYRDRSPLCCLLCGVLRFLVVAAGGVGWCLLWCSSGGGSMRWWRLLWSSDSPLGGSI